MGRGSASAVAFALLWTGCGGSSLPTDPGALGGRRVLTFVSGSTGLPVAGATVLLGGRTYETDASGRVVVEYAGTADLDVTASDYLLRQTRLGSASGRLVLWPLGPGYREDYVNVLLYKPSYLTREAPASAGDEPLRRVVATRVSVVPSADLLNDAAVATALDQAVAEINDAADGAIVFGVHARPMADVTFRVSVDPGIDAAALTWRDLRGYTITGGRIAFQSLAGARHPHFLTHELGHALGLEHSTARSDMMYFMALPSSPLRFSENERLSIRLLLQRPPGNRYPDNDRDGLASSSSAAGTCVVAD